MKIRTLLIVAMLVHGCASVSGILSENSLIAGVVAHKATTAIIDRAEDPDARAARVVGYADLMLELVDSSKPVTMNNLAETLISIIDWELIPEQDHQLVRDLINEIRLALIDEVESYVVLSAETEVSLTYIIDRIKMAALYYA